MADPFMQEIQAEFRSEAQEMLGRLERGILDLEHHPDSKEVLNGIFRVLHTIKGTGAAVEFYRLSAFVHHFEDAVDLARKGKLSVDRGLIDLALGGMDRIRALLEEGSTEPCARDEVAGQEPLLRQLADLLAAGKPSAPPPPAVPSPAGVVRTYHLLLCAPPDGALRAAEPIRLLNALQPVGTARVASVTRELPAKGLPARLWWKLEFLSDLLLAPLRQICAALNLTGDLQIEDVTAQEDLVVPLGPYFASDALPVFRTRITAVLHEAGEQLAALARHPKQKVAWNVLGGALASVRALTLALLPPAFPAVSRDNSLTRLAALATAAETWLESQRRAPSGHLPPEARAILAVVIDQARQLAAAFLEENLPPDLPPDLCAALQVLPPAAGVPAPAVSPVAETPPAVEKPAEEKAAAVEAATLRVEEEKINCIMRAVGDLLTRRAVLPLLAQQLQAAADPRAVGQTLKEAARDISHIAEQLQDAVMSIRMLPISNLYNRYPRLVRDLAHGLGKEIELVLEGGDTEIDKTVLDLLNDPLVHLLRNAVDHGIESPATRRAAGKPPAGVVRLIAACDRGQITVTLSDDGKGLDPVRLKAKAVEKGILTAEAARKMPDRAALDLIFEAGFSTADQVTDVSGRGVGMDVVRTNLRRMQGQIEIDSAPGRGTTIILRLPVKTILMVTATLLVQAGGQEYLLPVENVEELHKISRRQLHRFRETRLAAVRNAVYPVAPLTELLRGVPRDGAGSAADADEPNTGDPVALALMRSGTTRYAVILDRFISREQVVVKPLAGLATSRMFAGVTVMGDGRVILVIDPAELMDALQAISSQREPEQARMK